jgi:hypothetical protein
MNAKYPNTKLITVDCVTLVRMRLNEFGRPYKKVAEKAG